MTTEANKKQDSSIRPFLTLIAAFFTSVSAFTPHHPPMGFGFRFCALGFLTAVWTSFWRSLAQRFHWQSFARCVLPSVLFVLPLTALHAVDPSLGGGRGDWASGFFILFAISLMGVMQRTEW